MARQANPRLQSPQIFSRSSRTKSSDDFLRELEERLRLNRGGFSTFAEDTGATPGFIVPGGVPVRRGVIAETAGQTAQTGATPPTYPDIPAPEQANLPQQQTTSGGEEITQFLDAFNQAVYPSSPTQGMSSEQLSQIEQETGLSYGIQSLQDGGVLYSDGLIRYDDGTVREGDPGAEPVQNMQDGGVRYSDGSIRRPAQESELQTQDSQSAYQELANYLGYDAPEQGETVPGQRGLITGIFGDDRTITQEYGIYNPQIEPGSGYNVGTDIRTRDLQGSQRELRLPVGARVVDVRYDDGTRWGTYSGHEGYGNSILVELPSGEMLRFSHLSSIANVQPGDRIQAGEVFGTPGNTGNTYGEHLDLEYYNQEGQIDNPANFSGFTNPEIFQPPVGPMSSEDPNIQRIVERMTGEPQGPQQEMQQPTQAPQQMQDGFVGVESPLIKAAQDARSAGGSIVQAIAQAPQQAQQAAQPGSPQREALGRIPEQAAQTADVQAELGVSEGISEGPQAARQARVEAISQQPSQYNPYRHLLGNVTERIGDTLGIPEGAVSESIAGSPTKRTGQAFATELGKTNEVQQPGIREDVSNIGKDLQSRAQKAVSSAVEGVKGLFSNRQSNLENTVSDIQTSLEEFQPGAGIERLKGSGDGQAGAKVNLFSRKPPQELSPERVVGDSAGAELLPPSSAGASAAISAGQADIRKDTTDPFFKSAIFEKVRGFTNLPGQKPGRDQALSTDIFVEDFYQDPGQVNSVFGQTYLADPALSRATENVKQAYKRAYSGGEWDQGSVNQILSSLPDVLTYTPDLPEPKRKPKRKPTLAEYLAQGKTAAQWYAETGQQSTLDAIRGNPRISFDDKTGATAEVGSGSHPSDVRSAPSVSQVRDYGSRTGSGTQSVTLPSGRVVNAPPGTNLRVDSSGNVQAVKDTSFNIGGTRSNFDTPVKTPSAQLTSGSRNGIFNRAKEFAGGIFKRFFN